MAGFIGGLLVGFLIGLWSGGVFIWRQVCCDDGPVLLSFEEERRRGLG